MPDMTMTQAAEWAGKTRATIHKAIQSGRLSAAKDEGGVYQINPAELERVYGAKSAIDVSADRQESSRDTAELIATRREVELVREMLEDARREREDIRQDRDRWREQAETQTRLLTHQKATEAPPEPAAQPPAVIETPAAAPAPHGFRAKLAGLFSR